MRSGGRFLCSWLSSFRVQILIVDVVQILIVDVVLTEVHVGIPTAGQEILKDAVGLVLNDDGQTTTSDLLIFLGAFGTECEE